MWYLLHSWVHYDQHCHFSLCMCKTAFFLFTSGLKLFFYSPEWPIKCWCAIKISLHCHLLLRCQTEDICMRSLWDSWWRCWIILHADHPCASTSSSRTMYSTQFCRLWITTHLHCMSQKLCSKFFEFCDHYKDFSQLYTDGSKMGNEVAPFVALNGL